MNDIASQLTHTPYVLCVSGHDPSGGAGLQADIEAVSANGGFANTLPSCLTVQNRHNVQRLEAVNANLFTDMLDCLLQYHAPAAVKLGLMGSTPIVKVLADRLAKLNTTPIVLDPVLRASGGAELISAELIKSLWSHLLRHVTVLTPNRSELEQLTGEADLNTAVQKLFECQVKHVMVTGGDTSVDRVENRLYSNTGEIQTWSWPKLPHEFHGSGCTLAAALATQLASGHGIEEACERAQRYTQTTLENAIDPGSGPCLPKRWIS